MKDNYLEDVEAAIITLHENGTASIGLFAEGESWILADSKIPITITAICPSDPNKQLDFVQAVRKDDKIHLKRNAEDVERLKRLRLLKFQQSLCDLDIDILKRVMQSATDLMEAK